MGLRSKNVAFTFYLMNSSVYVKQNNSNPFMKLAQKVF